MKELKQFCTRLVLNYKATVESFIFSRT
uniref:Uncharacterized protein n=1 Tax=Arundo donax TaxID=35708 RepID=A0A0A8YMW7_ARUDO